MLRALALQRSAAQSLALRAIGARDLPGFFRPAPGDRSVASLPALAALATTACNFNVAHAMDASEAASQLGDAAMPLLGTALFGAAGAAGATAYALAGGTDAPEPAAAALPSAPALGAGAAYEQVSGATAVQASVEAASVDAAADATSSVNPWFDADAEGKMTVVKSHILEAARAAAAARADADEPRYADSKMLRVWYEDRILDTPSSDHDSPGGPDFRAQTVETEAPPPSRRTVKIQAFARAMAKILTDAGPSGLHMNIKATKHEDRVLQCKHLFTDFVAKGKTKKSYRDETAPRINRRLMEGTPVHLFVELADVFDIFIPAIKVHHYHHMFAMQFHGTAARSRSSPRRCSRPRRRRPCCCPSAPRRRPRRHRPRPRRSWPRRRRPCRPWPCRPWPRRRRPPSPTSRTASTRST